MPKGTATVQEYCESGLARDAIPLCFSSKEFKMLYPLEHAAKKVTKSMPIGMKLLQQCCLRGVESQSQTKD